MINTLVSLDTSLASQIALRFCCRLAQLVPMDMLGIHVEDRRQDGPVPGTGWVQQKWESSTLTTARQEIARLVESQSSVCPISKVPKLAMGDPDEEICRELTGGQYDLLVEGVLQHFDPAHLSRLFENQRYQQAVCPVLLVKNMPAFRKVAILLSGDKPPEALLAVFSRLFPIDGIAIDLIEVKNGTVPGQAPAPTAGGRANDLPDAGDEMAPALKALMERQEWSLRAYRQVGDLPSATGLLRNYSLVASYLPRHPQQDETLMNVLNNIPTAHLLCHH